MTVSTDRRRLTLKDFLTYDGGAIVLRMISYILLARGKMSFIYDKHLNPDRKNWIRDVMANALAQQKSA